MNVIEIIMVIINCIQPLETYTL